MSSKEVVSTTSAPAPLPQFSQAIKYNGLVYCSGNIGLDPKTMKIIEGGPKSETRQAIANLKNVLEAAGSSLANVIKMNMYITKMDDFGLINEAYDEFFSEIVPKPSRTCVAVYQLPFNARVEIECNGYVGN